MTPATTIRELFAQLSAELNLTWYSDGEERAIQAEGDAPLVGPLNLARPQPIQVIGPPERHLLESLGSKGYRHYLELLFASRPAALIFTDGLVPTDACRTLAADSNTPIIYTSEPDAQVIQRLLAHLQPSFQQAQPSHAEPKNIHGVFIEVLGKGVLLSGDASIGKSELALALISRGHRLIADDITEFTRINAHTLQGRCPPVLQDFLEVRGLGLLNVRAMFGNSAVKPVKNLHLIIDLQQMNEQELSHLDRLEGSHSTQRLLGVEIPQTTLPVAAGRNLAILAETAVRQHLLRVTGYDAAAEFSERQRGYIEANQQSSASPPEKG
ncbi:HPr(Ser) kinase/phosphatase [endosymbiont of Riftia pachyptila]|uniref:HPr kinase/phosphorylase n=1 Tax=endosymbiont of Riftia pachyptila (vent Ph05) TaxID=1048808 RepID=G2DB97_9GAMM|nr:HPr(Ser) kinase/phosphatase [endosymbiont of Riftia pachyptila]EGV52120.1 HPr kinase/phosphorylase [endosymbiont of Riftia pachyptila (vent Ph05)]